MEKGEEKTALQTDRKWNDELQEGGCRRLGGTGKGLGHGRGLGNGMGRGRNASLPSGPGQGMRQGPCGRRNNRQG